MYPFVTHTWNAIKGKCAHDCQYCYMKRFKLGEIRLDMKELNSKFGRDRFIFVGSSCDMWAQSVPVDWILPVLRVCRENNPGGVDVFGRMYRYLFQSKNPNRFLDFIRNEGLDAYEKNLIPDKSIFATTIETDEYPPEFPAHEIPGIDERLNGICKVREQGFPVTVTIEPIMRFDVNRLVDIITDIDPVWVSIGADSKGHGLEEPDHDDVTILIHQLSKRYELVLKKNLNRILYP